LRPSIECSFEHTPQGELKQSFRPSNEDEEFIHRQLSQEPFDSEEQNAPLILEGKGLRSPFLSTIIAKSRPSTNIFSRSPVHTPGQHDVDAGSNEESAENSADKSASEDEADDEIDLGVIKITSGDPKAAARAAAILKQVCLDFHVIIASAFRSTFA
jgi:hypothetical protein